YVIVFWIVITRVSGEGGLSHGLLIVGYLEALTLKK
ncbi:MAG: hypothetical protein ACI92G_001590, partial [Candidatus Pelagisphaera sp.]